MVRRRGLPAAGGQVTRPRKPKKSRSRLATLTKSYGRSSLNDKIDSMDYGSQRAESTPKAAAAHSRGAFPPPSRQLMTPQATQSTDVTDHSDDEPDTSFSESAEKLLSPHSKSIEDLRASYRQNRDVYDTTIAELCSQLPSSLDSEDEMNIRRDILRYELCLAQKRLKIEYKESHYKVTRDNLQWGTTLPKMAITKGWLDESVRRIKPLTSDDDAAVEGNLFYDLSHFFLATIIIQHQDSILEGRSLPSMHDIVEVFQRAEPRSQASSFGPFLELATGTNDDNPIPMSEMLLRLKEMLASNSRVEDYPSPKENTPQLNKDTIELEIDPNLDALPIRTDMNMDTNADMDMESPSAVDMTRSPDIFSDLPDFYELMDNVQDDDSRQQMVPAPVSDTEFISEDELPPDSNPWLASIRARASAAASVSNTPTSSAPIASGDAPRELSQCKSSNHMFSRRSGARKSEPIVLIDTPPRSSQRTRISDSIFVSDDESDDIPPSSNPHLAAAIRRMASNASNTPTSSASTSKTSTPKLPPHLAPVRKAAHRKSLDPSSQIPTEEERQMLDQEEYPVVDIIKEKLVNGEKKYLIKWQPIHGREFMDTWEPAENANALAVRDWELIKKKRKQERRKQSKKLTINGAPVSTSSMKKLAVQKIREPSPELGEDTRIFFVDTAGDRSINARFVPIPRSRSSSSASLSSTDQVSSENCSNMIARVDHIERDHQLHDHLTLNTVPLSELMPGYSSRPASRYAAQPCNIVAVSPEQVSNPTLTASGRSTQIAVPPRPIPTQKQEPACESTPKTVGNYWEKGKHPTQVQQRARMREKRQERRAAKAERLVNMTEKQRAEFEHSKAMNKKAKKERKRTKAERYAALPQEEKDRVDSWIAWKKGVRERTKEYKRSAKADKARKRQAAAQKAAGAS